MGFSDLYLDWADDLQLSPQGDLLLTTDVVLLKQRIIRRILTNPGTVLFEPSFGVGVPRFVDAALSDDIVAQITTRIQEAILNEDTVLRDPAPIIRISNTLDSITIFLSLWTTTSNQIALQFEVNRG